MQAPFLYGLLDWLGEREDEQKIEEYVALYFVKAMKVQGIINGM